MHDPAQVLSASVDRLLVLADHLELSAVSVQAVDTAANKQPPPDEPATAHEPTPTHAAPEPAPTPVYERQRILPPAVLERLEQIECALSELDGKLLGPRGKRRLAELRAEERMILEGLGYVSYLELMLSTTESSF